MTQTEVFLPKSIRPLPATGLRKKRHIPIIPGVIILFILLLIGGSLFWRVDSIEISACPALPPCAATNIGQLKGAWVPGLDLGWVRAQLETWPGIRDIEVRLELPGRLKIQVVPDKIRASIQIGLTFHALGSRGEIGQSLEPAEAPLLRNFPLHAPIIKRALDTGEDVAKKLGGRLLQIRWITPRDLQMKLEIPGRTAPLILRIQPSGKPEENPFLDTLINDQKILWADLRRPDRVVVRELL